jgi:hypothetical protein
MKKLQSYHGVKLICSIFFFLSFGVSANAQFADSAALFVVADGANLNAAENKIFTRLTDMDFIVEIVGQNEASDASTEDMSLILISATVSSGTITTNMPGLKDLETPIINWEPFIYDFLGFQEQNGGEFNITDSTEIEIVNDTHPLAGGLPAGIVLISDIQKGVSFGMPQGDVAVIAVNSAVDTQVVLFGYDKGAEMFSGNAPARRVGTFLLNDVADSMTEEGWTLFDASVIWAMGGGSTAVEYSDVVPMQFILYNNYPNPFNPSTKIKFSIPKLSHVTLKIFDVLGKEAAVLVNEEKIPGEYEIEINAANLSNGVYFYQLKAGSFIETKKMLLLK